MATFFGGGGRGGCYGYEERLNVLTLRIESSFLV
jgi:hypothetical protein